MVLLQSVLRVTLLALCFALCLALTGHVRAQTLELQLASLEQAEFGLRGVALKLGADGRASLRVQQLRLGGRVYDNLQLECGRFELNARRVRCQHGHLHLAAASQNVPLSFDYRPASQQLQLRLKDADLAQLTAWLPELADWQLHGQASAEVRYVPGHAVLALDLRQAAFSNATGTQAGEGITAQLQLQARKQIGTTTAHAGSATRTAAGWQLESRLDMPQGQLFIAPLYRDQALSLQARMQLGQQTLQVDQLQLDLPGWGQLAGSLAWQLPQAGQPGRLLAAELLTGPLALHEALPQLLQPYLGAQEQAGSAGLTAQGTATLGLTLDETGMHRLDVELDQLTLLRGQQGISGISAYIPWRRDVATQAEIRVAGAHVGKLALGAFRIPLLMQGLSFEAKEVAIPLLDGRLLLEDFHLEQGQGAWQGRLAAAIEPLAMPQLTAALDWPRMDGVLSASIPQISYRDATLELDGQLVVSVFDGYLSASRLRLIEPFGRLPRLQADVMARHIDLGMLTRTFSFGDISGYVDADVEQLEMHGLQPLAFAAQVRSSAGDYPKRISQRALQNISALGGAGAAAAIQRSVLRVFETFGYQQIGWRCWLKNGVCQMGGIEADAEDYVPLAERLRLPGSRASLASDNAYQLVQGGGLPALNVIGYNRRVDWQELTSRLRAVIAGNGRMEMR